MLAVAMAGSAASPSMDGERNGCTVSILVYHRFGTTSADAMTVTIPVFEEQLAWLRIHRYRIIPLRELVEGLRGPAKAIPSRAVVITVDDGHKSVYRELFPLILRHRFPVTLFVYPSAISRADYALSWGQLAEMRRTRLVDVQSHAWWHPNFNVERARLSPDAYRAFAITQFVHSREIIRQHLHGNVDMLAWPYGIHDAQLQRWAFGAGYVAAFTLVRHAAGRGDELLALPRYLVTDRDRGARLAAMVEDGARCTSQP